MKSGKKPAKTKGTWPSTTFGKNGNEPTKDEQIAEVQRQLLLGHSKADICETLTAWGWNTALYEESVENFKGITTEDSQIKLGFTECSLKLLYQKMMETGDYPGALASIREFAKLNNLHKAKTNQKKW